MSTSTGSSADASAQGATTAAESVSVPLWRNRDYQLLVTGRTLAMIGASMTSLAIMLLAFDLTGNSATTGVLTSILMVGTLLSAVPAGFLADRLNRKTIMVVASLVQAALLGLLVLLTTTDELTVVVLGVVGLLIGASSMIYPPAEQSALRSILPTEQLGSAMSVNQARSSFAEVVGPPLAGLLFTVGRAVPFLAEAAGSLIAGLCASQVRADLRPAKRKDRQTASSVRRDMLAGATFLARQPAMRSVVLMLTLFIFGVMSVFYAVTLGLQRDGLSAPRLGLMQTVFGATGIVGALLAGRILRRVTIGRALGVSLIVLFAALATQLVDHSYELTLGVIGATGVVFPVINVGILSYVMAITPADTQGRVNSILSVLQLTINPLVSVLAGVLVEKTSWEISLLPGLIALAAAALVTFSSARIRALPRTTELGALAAAGDSSTPETTAPGGQP